MYFPTKAMIMHGLQLAKYVDRVIIIDNTGGEDLTGSFCAASSINYRRLEANLGIATALNMAADLAAAEDYQWLLMLDQDSVIDLQTFSNLRSALQQFVGLNDVGLLSPVQVSKTRELRQVSKNADGWQETTFAMTSGSILSLGAYKRCGPFRDNFFVDHVDNEYCLRLRRRGFRVIRLPNIVLQHELGEQRHARLFGMNISYTRHSPVRSYYYVRNGLYVAFKFLLYKPQFLFHFLGQVSRDIAKTLLFEGDKGYRLRLICMGLVDFCRNRYGRFRSNAES
jgi:rhamnosyltransferase